MLTPIDPSPTYLSCQTVAMPGSSQLLTYLSSADLLPPLQSGFHPGHSTETAALRVLSDILLSVDRGDFTALVLLDLPAAFDVHRRL